MREDYIRTEQLAVGYGSQVLIRQIELHVKRGQIVTLIGPNGSGKSTILKSIIRHIRPLGGAVCLDGRSMKDMTEREIGRRMSILMTDRVRPEAMTCREVAAAGRYPHTGRFGILSREDRKKVDEALALVQASDLADQEFARVSDGQKQRVLLARAICQEPEAIVLDEPTSFLDIRHKLELLEILKELVQKRRVAVLMSLHELDLAQKISDYVVCVNRGAVERCGTPEEIFTPDYMERLYGIAARRFNGAFCSAELEPAAGKPEVFVIGGNGSGIPVYRRLQRQGIPFAAGVLHENDGEYPVARALAVRVIAERPFEPISREAFEEASRILQTCSQVICCLTEFGTMNEKNRQLARMGEEQNRRRSRTEEENRT